MNLRNKPAYYTTAARRFQMACIVLSFALVCLLGAGGLGLVSLRQGIAQNAREIKAFERKIADSRRRSFQIETDIARALHPEVLKQRTSASLSVPGNMQRVYVNPENMIRTRQDFTFKPFEISVHLVYNADATSSGALSKN